MDIDELTVGEKTTVDTCESGGALLVVTEPDVQLVDLVRKLREGEQRLQRNFEAGQSAHESLLWSMVTDGVPEAAGWQAEETSIDVLCDRALKLRGGIDGGPERLMMRERTRILARVLMPAGEPPRFPADLLALWDEATRLEPMIRLRVSEPRWRTGEDPVPFTTTPLSRLVGSEPSPLPPGKKTADPAEIPALVDGLLAFLAESELDPVIAAAHAPHLIGRIHPFVDGNGHTGRLLMCDLLARAGFGAPTLVAYANAHCEHAGEWAALMDSACLDKVGADELVAFQLHMLVRAQAAVTIRLDA